MIEYSDFAKVDMRVGTVIDAKPFPEARKSAYKLWIDFGESFGVRKTSAQITDHYELNQLIGQQLIAVVNFPPKQIGNFMSEVLVLGAVNEDASVILLQPMKSVKNGLKIS